ncbi:MAG: DUF1549 domain-containing protein [Pirellulales bacterium]|nr:DUF1549 domain-containing protein [Pirellulales bacterium]
MLSNPREHDLLAEEVSTKPAASLIKTTSTTGDSPDTVPAAPAAKGESTTENRPNQSKQQGYGIPQVAYINEMIRKGWVDNQVTPSPYATDGEWLRRVYLDVLGRIPTADEARVFLKERSADKRLKLVNRLLSPEYQEEYARNWEAIWEVMLIGRPSREEDQQRSMVNREAMKQYLRLSFLKNKTYDTLVYELVSATGSNTPGEANSNGAVNFLSGKMEENGVQATAKTAQLFLGMQVQCTQCHNHPFNEYKQNQFWELNAFFRQTKTKVDRAARRMVESVTLVNEDFRGEGNSPEKAELYYELRNGVVSVAYPIFVDGKTEINKNGMVSQVDRRTELAKIIVNSPEMPKAMVNRMWGHFLGYGFTKPIDDMGPHNAPTHPELLDRLAADFRKHSFNTKELIRWIVLSEPYALSSVGTGKNKLDDPSLGEKPKFSRFYLRQMRAEELYNSLMTATQAYKGSADEQQKAQTDWLRQFTVAFGTDEGDDATTFNGTIPQVLMMFNGDLIRQATNTRDGSFLARVAQDSSLNAKEKVNYLYLAALTRYPTNAELNGCNQVLAYHKGNVVTALQDIWWALLNTNEFILNH